MKKDTKSHHPTWVEIDKKALLYNIEQFRRILRGRARLMAVIKSNAYGHDLIGVSGLAVKAGVDYFGVQNIEEALILRHNNIHKPILVLTYFLEQAEMIKQAILNEIELPIYNLRQAHFLSGVASIINRPVKVHVKIDTGCQRLGILSLEAVNFVQKLKEYENLILEGVFSYSAIPEKDQEYTRQQAFSFNEIIEELKKKNIHFKCRHFAGTAACLSDSNFWYDMVRIGIGLYGLWPSWQIKRVAYKHFTDCELKPVMSWRTQIVNIKEIPKGTSLGRGLQYRVRRKTKAAIIPIGYSDGYDCLLSSKGEVLIHGKRCRILGGIYMNVSLLDVTNLENVKIGDIVTLLGEDHGRIITVEELAQKIGTFNYEIPVKISPLIPRVFV